MGWLRPFIVYSGRHASGPALLQIVDDYRRLLAGLSGGSLDPQELLAPGYAMPKFGQG
jgi:hypothetical protein